MKMFWEGNSAYYKIAMLLWFFIVTILPVYDGFLFLRRNFGKKVIVFLSHGSRSEDFQKGFNQIIDLKKKEKI